MALSDEDILARYREKRSPYITLATAKELHRLDAKFRHLAAAKEAATQSQSVLTTARAESPKADKPRP